MTRRPYTIRLSMPNIQSPLAVFQGQPIYPTDEWRRFLEDSYETVMYDGVDLVKQTQDEVETLDTDYYTRAESDALYATISTTYTQAQTNSLLSNKADTNHTHVASDITGGIFSDARIPSLSLSKITGLQTSLDGKVDSVDIADLPTDGSSAIADLEAKINSILGALR